MPENILIIKPSALGDIATALPVLSTIRKNFPRARISWLVRREFASILELADGLDEIVIFDRKRLDKWWCSPVIFKELAVFLRGLYAAEYDMVIDLQGLFRTGFFSWLTASPKRFGMDKSREFASMFYTDRIILDSRCVHVIDYYLKVARRAGCDKIVTSVDLEPPDAAVKALSELLESDGIEPDNYAVFIPTASDMSKCWPLEKFEQAASFINSEYSMDVIATGTASDKEYIDRMIKPGKGIYNLAGRTDIHQLVALLKNARLVLSNDTGPGQIASVLSVPMVMIVGNTNPRRIGPYGRLQFCAAVDPLGRDESVFNPKPEYGIENISVDTVLKMAEILLKGR